jgi:L,D-peptidoglycan transpeptidase YkuD (ErfK/YbiS/YcfS/YnhG family)
VAEPQPGVAAGSVGDKAAPAGRRDGPQGAVQYAKALVIDFNRWPAAPGRGAGIFLHVNGRGATAGCVSVPRATMDRIMGWIRPGAHPRIAIG